MFKTLGAIVAPKSFKLDKFVTGCKRYQKLSSALKKLIPERLKEQPDSYYRNGQMVTATFCGQSIATITDDNLSHSLYCTINTDGFWDKIDVLSKANNIALFDKLKFLVDEKQKKVLYVCYTSFQNYTEDFFSHIFENLSLAKETFSNDDFEIFINYEKFFLCYQTAQTSFLTSFFVSIIPKEYEFTSERLEKIATYLLEQGGTNGKNTFKIPQKCVPGIYVHSIEKYFNKMLPRNLCINILKLKSKPDVFKSYHDFFVVEDIHPNVVPLPIRGAGLNENFVFDEELISSTSTKSEETDEFISYCYKKVPGITYIVMKLKNPALLDNYLKLISEMQAYSFINPVHLASTPDYTAFYFIFKYATNMRPLNEFIRLGDDCRLEGLIRCVASKNWCIPFKQNVDLISCFETSKPGYFELSPAYLSKIDFSRTVQPNQHLFILQMIKTFVDAKALNINQLFACSFMKLLPYTFAQKALEYISTGTYSESEAESWGNILTSKHTNRIKFLSELTNADADNVSFVAVANSLERVQELVGMRSAQSLKCFSSSLDAFNTNSTLSYSFLASTFDNVNDDFASINNIVISPERVKNNEYVVLGVTWNVPYLRTIEDVIAGGINSKQLYTMICSIATKKYMYIEALRTTKDLNLFLVDKDFNVYINPNILSYRKSYRQNAGKRTVLKGYYDKVVSAFKQIIEPTTWSSFDHFHYDRLLYDHFDLTTVRSLQLCTDHNHYHLPNELCPVCAKICEITDNLNFHFNPYSYSGICFFKGRNNNYLLASPNFRKKEMIAQVKLGLENDLYNDFFFKPVKLSVREGSIDGILFNKIKFNGLLSLDTFKNLQRLKVVLLLYKNLLPKIQKGLFMAEDAKIFHDVFMHKDHPGEIIMFGLPYMDCSSVMSTDAAAKEQKIATTKKLFAEFIINYITSAESLKQVENSSLKQLLDDINNMNFSEEAIMNCLNTTCAVHQVPMLPNRKLCPVCLANGITEEIMEIKPMTYFKQLEEEETTYEGGEANLYPYENGEIQKLFKDNVDLVHKCKILGKALSYTSKLHEFNRIHSDIQFVTINKVLFTISNQGLKLKGYRLNMINDSFKISRLRDKEFVESKGYTRKDIIDILIKVCIGIEFLHSLGIYIGDLNGGNILIKGTKVYFIDIDGMSFNDVKNFVYTDTYIYPPSAANQNITMDDDWYSLAVQAFYYLTYSHPFRGVCDDPRVPSNVVDRMTKGYSVLGNRNIIPPSISIGWDFMPNYLITFFRQTFASKRRESMRTVLETFLKEITSKAVSVNGFSETTRLSPCKLAISENIYLSRSNSLIWKENVLVDDASDYTFVKSCGDYFIFKTSSNTVVVNNSTGTINSFNNLTGSQKYFAIKNRLFELSTDCLTLYTQKSIDSVQGTMQTVSRATTNKIINFFVTADLKFIFLEEEDSSHYAIYCNLQKLTSVDISQFNKDNLATYILYDEMSSKYLVLLCGNGITTGIVILPNGSHSTFTLQFEISKSNCYYANTLYYVTDGKIEFYQLKSKKSSHIALKFATANSLIYHEGKKFIICDSKYTYACLKP